MAYEGDIHYDGDIEVYTDTDLPDLNEVVGSIYVSDNVILTATNLTKITGSIHLGRGVVMIVPKLESVKGHLIAGHGAVVEAPSLLEITNLFIPSKGAGLKAPLLRYLNGQSGRAIPVEIEDILWLGDDGLFYINHSSDNGGMTRDEAIKRFGNSGYSQDVLIHNAICKEPGDIMNEEQLKWFIENGTLVQEYGYWSIKFKGTLVPGLTTKDIIDIIDCERPHE